MDAELDELIQLAAKRGYTPARAVMRRALLWLDRAEKSQLKPLEALLLRGELGALASQQRLFAWNHPHRWLRLCIRLVLQDRSAMPWLELAVDQALGLAPRDSAAAARSPSGPGEPVMPEPSPAGPSDPNAAAPSAAGPGDPASPEPSPAGPSDPAAAAPSAAGPGDPASPEPSRAGPSDQALLRQVIRAVGRFEMLPQLRALLVHPALLADPQLVQLACEAAARMAGQCDQAAAFVNAHALADTRAKLWATRELARKSRPAMQIGTQARWLSGLDLLLTCKAGMQDWVIQEVASELGLDCKVLDPQRLRVSSNKDIPYAKVLALRTPIEHAFCLDALTLARFAQDPRIIAQLVELFGQVQVPCRVQDELRSDKHAPLDHAHLVNDPRQSWVEISRYRSTLALRPRLRDLDQRFAYRVAQVPAASHPSVAAGLVRAAKVHARDRIWDPFVGSGLELIEAGLLARPLLLLGSDLDAQAIACAKANAHEAGVELQLVQQDARQLTLPPLSKVISNPPHGRRVAQNQDLARLYCDVLDRAYAALEPGGSVHWLCPQPEWLSDRVAALGAKSCVLARIDLGGVVVRYQRVDKP